MQSNINIEHFDTYGGLLMLIREIFHNSCNVWVNLKRPCQHSNREVLQITNKPYEQEIKISRCFKQLNFLKTSDSIREKLLEHFFVHTDAYGY